MDPVMTMFLGLDVAKAKVDCALLLNGKVKSKVVPNNQEGFETLKQWLTKQGATHVHACCEATGTYSDASALYLHDHGHTVSVVNPAQIAAYAQSQLVRAKTDALDAKLTPSSRAPTSENVASKKSTSAGDAATSRFRTPLT